MTRGTGPRPFVPAVVAVSAAVAVSLLAAAAAHAYWSATGVGSGTASTGSVVALTTDASTPSGTALVPSGTGPLVLTVTNPNPVPVVITSVQLDPSRTVEVLGSVGACPAPPLTVDVTTNLPLAAGSTATFTVPAGVTLGASAASGCQGATFTIPVTLSGGTS